MREFDKLGLMRAWMDILDCLGIDPNDPNFVETPERIARMYDEIFAGLLEPNLEELENHLTKTFPCTYDQMIVEKGIEAWSTCPHHFVPVKYQVDFAYMPKDQVLGVSKPVRVVQILAKRPVLQEQLTQDIVDYLERVLEPKGVIVKVSGMHHCMITRGVKAQAEIITSALTGVFENPSVKAEFLSYL